MGHEGGPAQPNEGGGFFERFVHYCTELNKCAHNTNALKFINYMSTKAACFTSNATKSSANTRQRTIVRKQLSTTITRQ